MDILLWEQIPEDVKESSPQGLKPEEEIARFTVDEHLSESDRINLYLSGGHEVQQRKAIDSIPAFLGSEGRGGWDAIQRSLLQTLPKLDSDLQVALAEALILAVQRNVLLSSDVSECLLPLAMDTIRSNDKGEEEAEAWVLLLLGMLPVIAPQQLLATVLPLAQSKGQVNESVTSRVTCCRMLGAMTPYLSPADVTARFAKQLLAACQDTDYQVRIAAAQQLPALARVLPLPAVMSDILPELRELLQDDEVQVRVSGLSGLLSLCQLLPREARVTQLLPLVRRHMQPLELAMPLQRALAAGFPMLLDAIRDDLEPSDAGLLYGCFRHLAARSDVELRRICASRLPAMMASPLPGSSAFYLHDTWTDLALDHDVQVRAAIAGQFQDVAHSVSPTDAARLLRRPLVTLLKDNMPEVRSALMPQLAGTLRALSGVDDMHKDSVASDVHLALTLLMSGTSNNWRCQAQLAAALPALPGLLNADVLADQWMPYAFELLLSGAAGVKPAAAAGLLHLLRGCRKERQRTDLYCRIIRELAWGKSCWARQAYIQLCSAACPLFSCRWVKEHLFESLIQLLSDPVPNVRLSALSLLPALKQTIRLPEDVERLEQLNSAMSNLMTDNDRDVAYAARSVHDAFKRTPLRMTGGAGLLDMNGSASGASDSETSDQAKELFEAEQLTLTIEELEKLRVEFMASGADRKGRRMPGAASDLSTSGSGGTACISTSSSGLNSHSSSGVARKNSKGRLEAHSAGAANNSSPSSLRSSWESTGSSSSSSSVRAGGNLAAFSWTPDRKFGVSNAVVSGASSSSSAAGNAAGSALKLLGAGGKAAAGGYVSMSSSSSSSFNTGSPRHASAGSHSIGGGGVSSISNTSSSVGSPGKGANGGAAAATGGLTGPAAAFQSPTGTNLMGNLRLPVLAGSPKAAGTLASAPSSSQSSSSSFSTTLSPNGNSSSRLGGAFGSGGLGLGSSGISAQSVRPPGCLTAATTPSSALFRNSSGSFDSRGNSSSSINSRTGTTTPAVGKHGGSSSSSTAAVGLKQQVGAGGVKSLGVQGSTPASRRFK